MSAAASSDTSGARARTLSEATVALVTAFVDLLFLMEPGSEARDAAVAFGASCVEFLLLLAHRTSALRALPKDVACT